MILTQNKVTGKARSRLKGSIRKLKHLQRVYGLSGKQQGKLNELIKELNTVKE